MDEINIEDIASLDDHQLLEYYWVKHLFDYQVQEVLEDEVRTRGLLN